MAVRKIVFIVFIASLLFQSCKPDSWSERLRYDNDEPYDVSVLHDVLKLSKGDESFKFIFSEDEFDKNIGKDSLITNSNLISIGRRLYLDSIELVYLMDFVERGNNVFLFSSAFDYSLLDSLLHFYDPIELEDDNSIEFENWEDEEEFNDNYYSSSDYLKSFIDTSTTIELIKNQREPMEIYRRNSKVKLRKDWIHFNNDVLDAKKFEVKALGFLGDSLINYIKVKHGTGHFYLNSTPFLLTNFHLIQDDFYNLTNAILEPMNSGTLYWDESLEFRNYKEPETHSNNVPEGPLAFILSEPSLKWAWYLLLLISLLYLVLGLRRKQKAIPVVHTNKNTSIEYAETIGQLYYQKKNHRNLVAIKMRHFRSFIAENYKIRVKYENKGEKESVIKKISVHSNLDYNKIKHIFDQYERTIGAGEVSKQLLVSFHDTLEDFYKNCK